MTVKILGSGCKNCIMLEKNTKEALRQLGITAAVKKVTGFAEIGKYGVMSLPGLVVDEKVVSFGRVLSPKEIVKIFEKLGGK